jgi:hypothetical protein
MLAALRKVPCLRSLPGLDRRPFVLLVLSLMGVPTWNLACSPTASGDALCGQYDRTQTGETETCDPMFNCPGTDLCINGFCIGSVCEGGTCEPSDGGAFMCGTNSSDSGASTDSGADAAADSTFSDGRADVPQDAASAQ